LFTYTDFIIGLERNGRHNFKPNKWCECTEMEENCIPKTAMSKKERLEMLENDELS
jgi:hypothetical protein